VDLVVLWVPSGSAESGNVAIYCREEISDLHHRPEGGEQREDVSFGIRSRLMPGQGRDGQS
jgi:hypothetical protein